MLVEVIVRRSFDNVTAVLEVLSSAPIETLRSIDEAVVLCAATSLLCDVEMIFVGLSLAMASSSLEIDGADEENGVMLEELTEFVLASLDVIAAAVVISVTLLSSLISPFTVVCVAISLPWDCESKVEFGGWGASLLLELAVF